MEQELIELFRTLNIKHRDMIQTYLNQFNIYLGQHRIFFHLEKEPNITFTELSQQLNVSKESLSMSIKRLEQNNYIKRKKDPKDKRRQLLSLTEEGLKLSKKCRVGFDEINYAMFIKLNENEKEDLTLLFKKMIEGLGE